MCVCVCVCVCISLVNNKSNEILPFAPTWMTFENIRLSEISQMEKNKNMISLICGIKKSKN